MICRVFHKHLHFVVRGKTLCMLCHKDLIALFAKS
jgi:hypothetical protein